MVHEILFTGKENAQRGEDLRKRLNISKRELTAAVEQERREGHPICATTSGENPGYYLAEDREEMHAYCRSLYNRAGNIFKTRRACLKAADLLPEREETDAEN